MLLITFNIKQIGDANVRDNYDIDRITKINCTKSFSRSIQWKCLNFLQGAGGHSIKL